MIFKHLKKYYNNSASAFLRSLRLAILFFLLFFSIWLFTADNSKAVPFNKVAVKEESHFDYMFIAGIFFGIVSSSILAFVLKGRVFAFSQGDSAEKIRELQLSDSLLKALYNLTKAVENRDMSLLTKKNNAERANSAKSNFLINVSHELRTPMHAIINFAEIGRSRINEVGKDKLLLYFSRIEESAERLLTLLNGMLDLTRLESGKINFNFARNDISSCVNSAISELSSLAERKKIKITLENKLSDSTVIFDYSQILQVIINLISNAIKFSSEGNKIEVLINNSSDANGICVSVTDEGSGIPKGEEEMIFEKFIQGSANKSDAGGSGLGLAICREIINAHGGKIWAENIAGKGAKFSFTIKFNNLATKQAS